MTFVEYVGFYRLARSEGLLLRYLTDAYRRFDALCRRPPATTSSTTSWSGWAN